jgi:hypothetical protein
MTIAAAVGIRVSRGVTVAAGGNIGRSAVALTAAVRMVERGVTGEAVDGVLVKVSGRVTVGTTGAVSGIVRGAEPFIGYALSGNRRDAHAVAGMTSDARLRRGDGD